MEVKGNEILSSIDRATLTRVAKKIKDGRHDFTPLEARTLEFYEIICAPAPIDPDADRFHDDDGEKDIEAYCS